MRGYLCVGACNSLADETAGPSVEDSRYDGADGRGRKLHDEIVGLQKVIIAAPDKGHHDAERYEVAHSSTNKRNDKDQGVAEICVHYTRGEDFFSCLQGRTIGCLSPYGLGSTIAIARTPTKGIVKPVVIL